MKAEKKIRLTVAIPTFNRNEILASNLEKLIPQLTMDCELIILDNCSFVPAGDFLAALIAEARHGHADIRIIRHQTNVGASENVLRCIENAKGEFVWLLGDDDCPADSAIDNILHELDGNSDLSILNLFTMCPGHHPRRKTMVAIGSHKYLSLLDNPGEFVFISGLVLRVDKAMKYMSVAHLWQSSHVPHFILSIMMLKGASKAVISPLKVVCNCAANTPKESLCSPLTLALGVSTLMLVPWDEDEFISVQKFLNNTRLAWVTPWGLANSLINLAHDNKEGGMQLARRYYKLIRRGLFGGFYQMPANTILFMCIWPMLLWPKFGNMLRIFSLFASKRRFKQIS